MSKVNSFLTTAHDQKGGRENPRLITALNDGQDAVFPHLLLRTESSSGLITDASIKHPSNTHLRLQDKMR